MRKNILLNLLFLWVIALVAFIFVGCTVGGRDGGNDDTADDDMDDDIDDDTDDDTDDDVDDDTDDDTDDDIEQPPAAPSNLVATGQGESILLEWVDNSNNEDGFYVYSREYGNEEFIKIATLDPDTTTYQENVGKEKDREYKVTAFNVYGESSASNIGRAKTIPNEPTDLGAASSIATITLSWTDNSNVENGFNIYYRPYGSSNFSYLTSVSANTTSYSHDAGEERDYEYKVLAYNDAGESGDSNIARAHTVPAAPTNLTATGGATTISLSWTDNSNMEDGFNIYYRPYGSGSFSLLTSVSANTTSYVHNAGIEKSYEYKVKAYNDIGESSESNTAGAQTLTPNAPTDLVVSNVKKYRATLNWQDNSNIEDGYKVERRLSEGSWQQIKSLPANTTTYTDTTLDCEKEYEYRVRAYKSSYNSDYSNTDLAETLECWTIYTLDSIGNMGLYTSIALDSYNNVHISYYDGVNGYLKYATNASGSWQYFVLDSSSDVGRWTSIVLDSNDNVHISYCDWSNADLKYATNALGSWQIYVLDFEGLVGFYTSIALDSNDNVYISYSQSQYNKGVLKYITNKANDWQRFMIDSSADLGYDTSIALDLDDYIHISYYDLDNQNLKYATNKTGSWQCFTVDSAGNVGANTSIAVDPSNKLHISYAKSDTGDLKYALFSSGAWQIFTIDSAPTAVESTSIALDSNDKVHIGYYADGDLKYATNALGSWSTLVIDSVGNVGLYTSIAIDPSDKLHISYYDATNKDLKYATNAEVD